MMWSGRRAIFAPTKLSCTTEELLGYRLTTIHDLYFMQKRIEQARVAIAENTFPQLRCNFLESYKTTHEDKRIEQKTAALKGKKREDFPVMDR